MVRVAKQVGAMTKDSPSGPLPLLPYPLPTPPCMAGGVTPYQLAMDRTRNGKVCLECCACPSPYASCSLRITPSHMHQPPYAMPSPICPSLGTHVYRSPHQLSSDSSAHSAAHRAHFVKFIKLQPTPWHVQVTWAHPTALDPILHTVSCTRHTPPPCNRPEL